VPAYDHVFVIVMENRAYNEIIGSSSAPYINSLLPSGALATNYFDVSHPSLPNYLGLVGGSTYGITSDCTTCWISAANVADNLESSGSTWKGYMEGMPSACYVGDSYPYAQKHDPFVYFNDIRTNTSRCNSHVVPYTQLSSDLGSTSTTPNYAFITPDMCHDMHDCATSTGDSWLQSNVPQILNSTAFKTQRSLLVLTWDESETGDQVATILLGSGVSAGRRSTAAYNHYSLLHTIEAARGLSTLTSSDAGAATMSDLFATVSSSTPCTGVGLTASPSNSAAPGTQVVFNATATGCPNPLYQFWILPPGSAGWQIARPYSTGSTFSWSTSGLAAGTYLYTVWARDSSSAGTGCGSLGCSDAYFPAAAYALGTDPCSSVSELAVGASPQAAGSTIMFTASAVGCSRPLYQFWTLAPGHSWQIAQAYSAGATFSWNTTGLAPGSYLYTVWARDSSGPGTSCGSLGCQDAYFPGTGYTLTGQRCSSVTESASPGSPQASGTSVTFTAGASGCPHPLYQFWILRPGSQWQVVQAYSSSATFIWSTTGLAPGSYLYTVWARDSSSPGTSCGSLGCEDAYFPGTAYTLR